MKRSFFKLINLVLILISFNLSSQEKWMNIFVHGTIGLRSSASLGLFFRLLNDRVEGTDYARYVECLRHSPRIYSEQAIQGLGLQKVDLNNPYNFRGAYLFSLLFKKILEKYSCNNNINIFYTFGWSGLLSYSARFKESIKFYEDLRKEVARLKQQNSNLKIRIIGYSHGGNVALNLAAIRERYYPQDDFVIDELINIGTPVQSANSCLVYSPIFKKIYQIYSHSDPFQTLDIFAPCGWVSRRKFKAKYCSCPLPEKLTQIGLCFQISKYLKCRQDINWHPKPYCFCGYSPVYPIKTGHFELWLFGWNKKFYNQCFPLNPLPVVLLTPLLINWTKFYTGNSINVKVLPDHEIGVLNIEHGPKNIVKPFFTRLELNYLKNLAYKFKPYECISELINYDL